MNKELNRQPEIPIEKDPVWDLLSHASHQEADPMFSRNVMRSIRLEPNQASLWQRLLAPRPALLSLTGIAACVAITFIVISNSSHTPSINTPLANHQVTTEVLFDEIADLYDAPEELDKLITPVSFSMPDDTELILATDHDDDSWDM